ncbi:MAG: NAD-dependent epimerase/dehydratase family protein [Deltaproteobacteria bacterium]|nr:NAD-dependent epimerase/dehydratase family protein [Deltaproteobacteria bacterium]
MTTLVTGGSGSLGRAVVQQLLERGWPVRVFDRRAPQTPAAGVEYVVGDLADPAAVDKAVDGCSIVIHAGAVMKGTWEEHRRGTVEGTRNVVEACGKHGVGRLVHISSMSVIDWAGSDNGPVDEQARLEPHPERRGEYTRAKLEAERIVVAAAAAGLRCVILRPGQIFGGGIPLINGAVAREARGRWLVLGDGTLQLPLVYIDDVVQAILAAAAKNIPSGEIIHIVDPEHLTQDEVLAAAGGGKSVVHVPRGVVFALGKLSELPLRVLGKQSPIGAYRLKSALARLRYDSDRAQSMLGWKPQVGVREGIRRVMQQAAR